MSTLKKIGFWRRGKRDKKRTAFCPYTPKSTEAYYWWLGWNDLELPKDSMGNIL